jgi:hypothetical protein
LGKGISFELETLNSELETENCASHAANLQPIHHDA